VFRQWVQELDRLKNLTGTYPWGVYRDGEVAKYLAENADVDRFVIFDDRYTREFEKRYPENYVYCRILDEESYEKGLEILTRPRR
jgi:hypothetical protein